MGKSKKNSYYVARQSRDIDVSTPGMYPYTRGIHEDMYLGRLWTMRQYSGFGTVKETNKRFKYLTSQGTTGLSIAFDLPTQMGLDSDDPRAEGEVGKTGVAIDTIEDMQLLFDSIDLAAVSTSMTINSTAHILLALYLVVAESRGIPWHVLKGTVQNDLLKEFIARGTYIFEPHASLRITTDLIEFCSRKVPQWNPISISGYHMREAGCTAVQEVAFTLLNGLTYVSHVVERGLSIDEFAPRLAFFFNCHNNFFEEAAKFRAARRLWAKIIKERYAPRNEKSLQLRFHTQTAGSSLTAQQPLNNIVRTSYQALAAVLGGTQSLHTNSYDEAISLPSEEAARIAIRTQQILASETEVPDVVDPLGGSYYVEYLTDKIESEAMELITRIETSGGMLQAITTQVPQSMIEDSAYEYQKSIETGKRSIVGVNVHIDTEGRSRDARKFTVKKGLEAQQIVRVQKFKKKRDNKLVLESLEQLKSAARGQFNIMDSVCECVRRKATLGEITLALSEVFKKY